MKKNLVTNVIIKWLVFNSLILSGSIFLHINGEFPEISVALPALILLSVLSLVSISALCFYTLKRNEKNEKH